MHVVVLTTQDNYTVGLRAAARAIQDTYGIEARVAVFNAADLADPNQVTQVAHEVARADFVLGAMLFGEAYVRPLEPILAAATCPVAVIMSNPTLSKLTRLGKFQLAKPEAEGGHGGMLQALKPKHGHGEVSRQLKLVKSLTKILKFLPGRFRDLHSFISLHQYWVHNTPANLQRMLCMIGERYVPTLKGRLPVQDPELFPDVALWHPDASAPFADLKGYLKWQRKRRRTFDQGVVGLLSLRLITLSENVRHLTALVHALEARNLEVRLAYTATLDNRPALETFFKDAQGQPTIDLLLTTSGFALAGGMAQSRPEEARVALEELNVPFMQAIPLVFQRVEAWQQDERGLNPMHLAMNVALAELEGATEPTVYGGPSQENGGAVPVPAQIERLADRIARRVALRRKANAQKRLALVLFNYPPNMGSLGTAAYLDVFASIYRLMQALQAEGYQVELPTSADELRRMLVEGNALAYGSEANVGAHLHVDDYRRLFPAYAEIEPFWGAAPGELLNDGKRFQILGRQFGNLFIGVQPTFGYERDPMRMLMARDAAPHHGFAAFYTWLDRVFQADAVVHVGTHGALEFMPGKQAGLGPTCWPSRLLGGMPNIYYYCVNNPSEATIAKRRGAANLVSYLVPPVQHAGLYKGLRQLKDALEQYRQQPDPSLLELITDLKGQLGLGDRTASSPDPQAQDAPLDLTSLSHQLLEIEQRLIPVGLHVLGRPPAADELTDILTLVASFYRPGADQPTLPERVAAMLGYDYAQLQQQLACDEHAQAQWRMVEARCRAAVGGLVEHGELVINGLATHELVPLTTFLHDLLTRLRTENELPGLLNALAGGYTPPSPGNDVVRDPSVVPTGRNLHGLDPYRIPTPAAQATATACVDELLNRLSHEQGGFPETVALVLWGTDNLKTGGEGVAQALALLGARPLTDELGKLADVALIPLAELGRPRVDVVCTVSGIFRDIMAHQALLIDKAARLAAAADEPLEANFVRKHALALTTSLGLSLDEAAARVFSNAPGSYGANVNHMVEQSTWQDDQELGEVFMNRKGFALAANGAWHEARPLLEGVLATVEATFQNVDSIETGISDVDHYYEYLGGVTKSVERLRGARPTVLVAEVEAFSGPGRGRVRSLEQLVRLESRAKLLNPKWFEGMLAHGYEGVHEIEVRLSNTYGWSATTNGVDPWVYQGVAETYLLDAAMRERLASLNPQATAGMAQRLLEAHQRGFWPADEATLEQLRDIYADLEDRLEGVGGR